MYRVVAACDKPRESLMELAVTARRGSSKHGAFKAPRIRTLRPGGLAGIPGGDMAQAA